MGVFRFPLAIGKLVEFLSDRESSYSMMMKKAWVETLPNQDFYKSCKSWHATSLLAETSANPILGGMACDPALLAWLAGTSLPPLLRLLGLTLDSRQNCGDVEIRQPIRRNDEVEEVLLLTSVGHDVQQMAMAKGNGDGRWAMGDGDGDGDDDGDSSHIPTYLLNLLPRVLYMYGMAVSRLPSIFSPR